MGQTGQNSPKERMLLTFLQLVIQETTVSAQGVSNASLCSDQKAADGVWQEGCIVRTCRSGAVEESLADECVQLIEKIVEEKIVEKLAVKDPSYLYLDSTTIVDMNTLQFLTCQQDFPVELSYFWSQAAVVHHNGQDRLMVCGGPDMTGCFVSASGWQSLNATSFKYRSQAASSMMAGGGWLVTGGSVGRLDGRGFNYSSSVLLYSNNHWEEFNNLPVEVTCHCQVTVGDTVYIIGGLDSSDNSVSTVYKLSNGIWTQYQSLNRARWGHACAVLDNTVYVIGGRSHDTSVEMLSLDSNSWVYGPSLPDPYDAYDAQTVVYNDTLYVFEAKGMIYRYDRRQDLWEDLSNREYILLPFNERIVFPAPLLTEEQLPCK